MRHEDYKNGRKPSRTRRLSISQDPNHIDYRKPRDNDTHIHSSWQKYKESLLSSYRLEHLQRKISQEDLRSVLLISRRFSIMVTPTAFSKLALYHPDKFVEDVWLRLMSNSEQLP